MSTDKKTLGASYFNALYGNNQDPWNFEGSEYEKGKYGQTMLMIPNEIYANVLEIGCSNGILSELLQTRSQKLLAIDASDIAVANARKRLSQFKHVSAIEMEVPRDFPQGKFDLILFSEVGYFMAKDDLLLTRDKIIDALLPGGHLLLVHWTPLVDEFPLTGDQVHGFFLDKSGPAPISPLRHLENKTEEQYRMDLFQKQ